jgi:AraC-like DNA-binding protein
MTQYGLCEPKNKNSLLYLFDDQTIFLGRLNVCLDVHIAAPVVLITLEGTLIIEQDTTSDHCTSCLLSPGSKTKINFNNALLVIIYLDPFCQYYARLSHKFKIKKQKVYFEFINESIFSSFFHQLYKEPLSPEKTVFESRRLLEKNLMQPHSIDKRVHNAVSILKKSKDKNISVDKLAEAVHLSVPQLYRVFKKQTGVAIRRYRTWHRIYIATQRFANGENLTDAAIAAGFIDSAHFTRSFRLIFGINPSFFLSASSNISIFVQKNQIY